MIDLQAVLPEMLKADAAAPRVTFYDDATGERGEFSGKGIANWAAKAANFLGEEAEAGPGTTVGLALQSNWRAAFWALPASSVGARVLPLVLCWFFF